MKQITKKELKEIIKEETQKVLEEAHAGFTSGGDDPWMVKLAAVRAKQAELEKAVKELEATRGPDLNAPPTGGGAELSHAPRSRRPAAGSGFSLAGLTEEVVPLEDLFVDELKTIAPNNPEAAAELARRQALDPAELEQEEAARQRRLAASGH